MSESGLKDSLSHKHNYSINTTSSSIDSQNMINFRIKTKRRQSTQQATLKPPILQTLQERKFKEETLKRKSLMDFTQQVFQHRINLIDQRLKQLEKDQNVEHEKPFRGYRQRIRTQYY